MTPHPSNSLKKLKLIPSPYFKSISSIHTSHNPIISHYSHLINHSISIKTLSFTNFIHTQLLKLALTTNTFLGNRLLHAYSKLGSMKHTIQLFDDMPNRNLFTWNVLLIGLFKFGDFGKAALLFDEMPERDVVSWNSMISGYSSNGYFGCALDVFRRMQSEGVRPNAYTFSIATSCVGSASQGKEVHGTVITSGLESVVVCNCLIDMYGKLQRIDYAFAVFFAMEELDVVSWNSLISGCGKSGDGESAWVQFCFMRSCRYSPDQCTMSTMITVCSSLRALEKGKQVFGLCIKLGFNSNAIVTSATIDMFSKCNRLEDSIRLFEEIRIWDAIICNSMISSYVRHGYQEDALWLFVMTLRANIQPTEFTLSNILTSASCFVSVEQGAQIHSLVLKLGLDSETVVASSLVDMYAKVGIIDSAVKIFRKMIFKDLVSWNTMITGLARNGRELEALESFDKLLEQGISPDRITFSGVLLACSHRGLLHEGIAILSSMEEEYGVIPRIEHYAWVVDMMCQAGDLPRAIEIVETMPHEPNAFIWESLLLSLKTTNDLHLMDEVAEKLMELEPHSSLPYWVLAQGYEMTGRWESLSRVRKAMKDRGIKNVSDSSWIGIRNQVFVVKGSPLLLNGSDEVYSILRLLIWEMLDEGYIGQI